MVAMEATPRNELDPLMTPEEVADYLGLKRRTIYNRVSTDRTFPRIKLGRTLRFRKSEIDHWIVQQTANAEEEAA